MQQDREIGLAEIHIDTDGMVTEHNFPCPVCQKKHVVLYLNEGHFKPCWDCQNNSWVTLKIESRFLRWLLGLPPLRRLSFCDKISQ